MNPVLKTESKRAWVISKYQILYSFSECSYRDEEEDVSEDEEDQTEVLPHMDANQRVVGGLEWDDEDAISTNARSYRV